MININKTIQIKTCNKITSGSTVSVSLLTGGERAPGSGKTTPQGLGRTPGSSRTPDSLSAVALQTHRL